MNCPKNRTQNRIMVIIGTIFLLMLLLACVSPETKSEAEMLQACRQDPSCHPAPDAVMMQIYQTQQAGK